ncbi:MAG: hypothetical protein NVSMB51_01070 [Solirubrobacteraceae bacterium]
MDIHVARRGNALFLELAGELDLASAPLLAERLAAAERTNASLIVVDLTRLQFMDLAGLGVLLAAEQRSPKDGFRLRIVERPDQMQQLIDIGLSATMDSR